MADSQADLEKAAPLEREPKTLLTNNSSAAFHIDELCEIDNDVRAALELAGKAINALTGSRSLASSSEEAIPGSSEHQATHEQLRQLSLEEAKIAFQQNTESFLQKVQVIAARLRREVHALEAEGIISPSRTAADATAASAAGASAAGATASGSAAAQTAPGSELAVLNGGLGNLDIGWLNSRSDGVSLGKEVELWEQARAWLSTVMDDNKETGGEQEGAGGEGSEEMVIEE